jgi:hypothetical protein
MGGYPSQPTPDQVQALLQAPNTPGGAAGPVGPPTPISPFRAAIAPFDNPQQGGGNIWDRLMANVGQGKMPTMPGTTIGAPAGAPGAAGLGLGAAPQPPPMLPQTQMPRPPGIPGLAQTVAGPGAAPAGGNNALLAQYMALQQLMRGA